MRRKPAWLRNVSNVPRLLICCLFKITNCPYLLNADMEIVVIFYSKHIATISIYPANVPYLMVVTEDGMQSLLFSYSYGMPILQLR